MGMTSLPEVIQQTPLVRIDYRIKIISGIPVDLLTNNQ
jgi:hypothetical protein